MRRIEEITGLAADPLWDFALEVYRRPGVAEACLTLQDRRGADVNLLIYALWAGARLGRTLDADAVARARAAAGPWAEAVVRPLRAVRRAMKTEIPAAPERPRLRLREQVKLIELAAERVELATLGALQAEAGGRPPPPGEAARLAARNLLAALAGTAVSPAGDRATLLTILAGAVPDATPEEAEAAFG